MKIRQALKICDNITTRNVVMVQKGNTLVVVGIKNTPYTFRQFCKAVRVIKKAYKRYYNGKDTRL